jgi:hypothetical protein
MADRNIKILAVRREGDSMRAADVALQNPRLGEFLDLQAVGAEMNGGNADDSHTSFTQ